MPKTAAPPQPGQAHATSTWRGRALRIAVPVVALVGATVAIMLVVRHDGNDGRPGFRPADHQVTYQVAGDGTAREITYSDGTANPMVLHMVGLPWQTTVKVAVSADGGIVNLNSTNPGSGRTSPSAAAPLVCRILVDGKTTAQRTSTDGSSDTSCSAALAAKRN
jgi:hypothetical protein